MNKKLIFSITLVVGVYASVFAANTVGVYKSSAVASYYADKFHGRKTANGETFDMYALTAAHKSLPFNTMIKVTNLENGKSVVVRVNDRGPFVAGREIDLSKAAASQLGMIATGVARVSLEIVSSPEKTVAAENVSTVKVVPTSSNAPSQPSKILSEEAVVADVAAPKPSAERWDIQLGAFSSRLNAETFAKKAQKEGIQNLAYQTTNDVTRVVIRDLSTEQVAPQLEMLESKGYKEYLVKERRR